MGINFNKAEFILSAVKQSTFIRDGRPQVAFAGRSNVGKSSVINRLLNRKNFARVGATPGKTTQVNYFLIDGKIYFTDLPGYGYAKVSKEERDRWGRLMENYFQEEGLVSLGVLIVDARHKPTADDETMCTWFKDSGCPLSSICQIKTCRPAGSRRPQPHRRRSCPWLPEWRQSKPDPSAGCRAGSRWRECPASARRGGPSR